MNETLTLDLIRDAQANGLEGTSAVLEAMTGRIEKLSDAAARRMTTNGMSFEDCREDFRQDAAVALFEALPRFEGDSVDVFYGFMWRTIEDRLKDKVREARNQGADEDAVKVFASMLERADGDVYLAEKFAQTVPPKGRRLSADRAQAARMSWQGTLALDYRPNITDEPKVYDKTVNGMADALASSLGIPEDLITADDLTSEERRQKHAIVNAILDSLSPQQRSVIVHSFGIGGASEFGYGDASDNEGMAALLGMVAKHIPPARSKGMRNFAAKYIKAVAKTDEEAQELADAAAANLTNGGRK
ncbi:hypothetical protein [Streptomyces sp. IBSBF 3010]|uniref:hypothetical protein n=1 Tax=Streptomyces sp. IBSBF 3010 TaxID=2903526 RepID=UPI002FDC7A4F